MPILIGRYGRHMKEINRATDAKVRVRGRGSGHLEVDRKMMNKGMPKVSGVKEAPVPLTVAITLHSAQRDHFRTAVDMTISKLQDVQDLFVQFCEQRTLSKALLWEELWSFGEMSKDAEIVLADLLPEGGLPQVKNYARSRRKTKTGKVSDMEKALGTASAQGTAAVLLPFCGASLPHDACSDRHYVGFGSPFPGGYGSGYSGQHVSWQPGTASNDFNLLPAPAEVATTGADHQVGERQHRCEISKHKPGVKQRQRLRMQLDVDRLLADDEVPIGLEWSVSLPDALMHSVVAEASFGSQSVGWRMPQPLRAPSGPASSLDRATFEASLMTQGLAASLCQQRREQQLALAEQAEENPPECEADWQQLIASEVSAFLQDVARPTEGLSAARFSR